jgi:hypothetical protein
MRLEIYELRTRDSMMTFEFVSEGPKGSIKKRLQFQRIGQSKWYNLAFGDVEEETDDFDDKVVSHNNDTKKVLATVTETVKVFINKYPKAEVYAEGSTFARNRLYRIGISNNLEEITEKFKVLRYLDNRGWVEFEKNENYSAFLIKLKR